ncbi:hypothetical protein BN1723_017277 [Verticillium longisporum]|uniref:Uncharacterized protein n=1 Tax=Verticillium longisporum TaxID=100787 RepID=A0A0G4KS26_VERLO|nr:hypothetical protein BN1723_017277 [Verticillium longisporum]
MPSHMNSGLDRFETLAPDIAILLDKFGQEATWREVANHVNLHQYLARTPVTGADAYRWHRKLLRHERRNLGRHCLHYHGEGAGLLHSQRILQELRRSRRRLALNTEAAQGVLALWGQADVAEYGDAGLRDLADGGGHLLAAFELDTLHTALLDEANRRLQRLVRRNLIRAHRQVANLDAVSHCHGGDSARMVLTVKALLVARATDRQCNSISSTSTSLVSSIPKATMARLSPTRIMSMPAMSPT